MGQDRVSVPLTGAELEGRSWCPPRERRQDSARPMHLRSGQATEQLSTGPHGT